MRAEHQHSWQPMLPQEVMKLFQQAAFPWWIAGGFAIDHFVGRTLRPHNDIDVLLLRKNQQHARELLKGWDCQAADPATGKFHPWNEGETLPATIHDVWCRENNESPWRIQLMLDEGDEQQWRSRRCASVTRQVEEMTLHNAAGIPFLVPEVQLFYKSKEPREKDEQDFSAVLPLLSAPQRAWLSDAIIAAYGKTNAWLAHMILLFI